MQSSKTKRSAPSSDDESASASDADTAGTVSGSAQDADVDNASVHDQVLFFVVATLLCIFQQVFSAPSPSPRILLPPLPRLMLAFLCPVLMVTLLATLFPAPFLVLTRSPL